jgi:hypothetical protein
MRKRLFQILLIVLLNVVVLVGVVVYTSPTHDPSQWFAFLKTKTDVSPYTDRALRWQFCDDSIADEKHSKELTMKRIQTFWKQLQADAPMLIQSTRNSDSSKLVDWMDKYLGEIDQHMMWEFGPSVNAPNVFRLCLSTEGRNELEPIMSTIVNGAPPISGLKLIAGRERMPSSNVSTMFATRAPSSNLGEISMPPYTVKCTPNQINQIDVVVGSPTFSDKTKDVDRQIAFLITDLVLGENDTDKWLGAIIAEPTTTPIPKFQPEASAKSFYEAFQKAKEKIRDAMPAAPYYAIAKPEGAGLCKMPGNRLTLRGYFDPVTNALINPADFRSERYSKNNERFCYLRVTDVRGMENVEKRDVVENDLDDKLRAAKVGCIVGSGFGGQRTVYFDMCISDFDKAIPLLRTYCAKKNLAKKATLLFYDADWHREWVSMSEQAGLPRLPDESSRW